MDFIGFLTRVMMRLRVDLLLGVSIRYPHGQPLNVAKIVKLHLTRL